MLYRTGELMLPIEETVMNIKERHRRRK
jgi:hypothetical protein